MGIELAAIAAVASGGLQIWQQQEQAKMEQDMLKQQETLARQQADEARATAERQAEVEEIQGIETARRQRLADKKRMERQRAIQATSGVSLTEGSPLKIEEQNMITSMLNAEDIFNQGLARAGETRFAGEQQRRGLLFEADQFKFQRKASKRKAKMDLITGIVNTGISGMGAAGKTGGFGSKGGGMSASQISKSPSTSAMNYQSPRFSNFA